MTQTRQCWFLLFHLLRELTWWITDGNWPLRGDMNPYRLLPFCNFFFDRWFLFLGLIHIIHFNSISAVILNRQIESPGVLLVDLWYSIKSYALHIHHHADTFYFVLKFVFFPILEVRLNMSTNHQLLHTCVVLGYLSKLHSKEVEGSISPELLLTAADWSCGSLDSAVSPAASGLDWRLWSTWANVVDFFFFTHLAHNLYKHILLFIHVWYDIHQKPYRRVLICPSSLESFPSFLPTPWLEHG